MDPFVKKAFQDSVKADDDKEYQSYKENIVDKIAPLTMAVGVVVGLEKMESLSRVVNQAGEQETLADFVRALVTAAFHIGYGAGREAQ